MPELEAPPAPETATQAPQGVDAFDDQFKDLDESPAPKAAPAAPEPKSEPAKPSPKAAPAPEKGKTVEKQVSPEKPKGEPTKEPEPAPGTDEFEPPKAFAHDKDKQRGWALSMGKRAKTAETKLKEVEARLIELEKAPPKTNGHDPVLTKQLEDLRKRNEEYENELRITRYERSKEYEEKHQKPIKLAESRAQRDIESLIVEQRQKDEDGEEKVISSRPGAWKDFVHVYNLPRPEARRTAKALFGEDADLVIKHYDDIHQRYEDAQLAVEDYRKRGKEQETQTEAQKKQEAQYMEEGWEKANAMIVQKNPEQFDLREDDEEGNELLTKGRNFVKTFMSKDREKYPLPQQILADARIAQWASAHLRDQRDLKKLKAELTEKDKLIEELRGSGPGKPETEKGKIEDGKIEPWEQAIEKAL